MPPMSKVPQAHYVEGDMANVDKRVSLTVLTQIMTTQVQVMTNHVVLQENLEVRPQSNDSTLVSTIRDFMRIIPPTLHITNVDEDP